LSDDVFFSDLKAAAQKFFDEVRADPTRQADMEARLADIGKGGAIYVE
jgi:hypothetical protein